MQVCSMRLSASLASPAARPSAGRQLAAPARPLYCSQRQRQPLQAPWRLRAEPEGATEASASSTPAAAAQDGPAEMVFYEGSGSNAELAISLLLSATLIFLPLTIASIGRRLWVSYKFTDKRLIVTTNSPVLKREVQVEYSKIKEIRSAPRAFGAWGDVVFFLKDGSRLPIAGLERYQEIVDYIQGKMT